MIVGYEDQNQRQLEKELSSQVLGEERGEVPEKLTNINYGQYKEGMPKISRKTVYYVSIHAKHVEKRECRDEKTIYFQLQSGSNTKIATPA